jgi:hypothetical protein
MRYIITMIAEAVTLLAFFGILLLYLVAFSD